MPELFILGLLNGKNYSGIFLLSWPLEEPEGWDILMGPFLSRLKVIQSILCGRQKVC